MKTLHIASPSIEIVFDQLKEHLGGSLRKNSKECTLEISNDIGKGTIRSASIKGGISFLEFNITFFQDVTIKIESVVKNAVNFMYCMEGAIEHQFKHGAKTNRLEAFQTGIISNINTPSNLLYFKKDMHINSSLITVNCTIRDTNSPNVLINQLVETFINDKHQDFMHIGSYNLKIAERIQQMNAISQDGVVRTLLIEGMVNIILALEIQQHKKDVSDSEEKLGSLTKREMKAIRELSKFIQNYPETSLTVSDLCVKVGLTSSKLQEGFKLMHNHTVNDYIREIRVKKSEELIKTTDLNISQIVYTVGFSSRSYFSKIFKQKYNCSPNVYKAKNRAAISA